MPLESVHASGSKDAVDPGILGAGSDSTTPLNSFFDNRLPIGYGATTSSDYQATTARMSKDEIVISKQAEEQLPVYDGPETEVRAEEHFVVDDSRKIGITGAAFLILNKMIGTGIFSTPSGIFAATGSVGISLMLWVIGGILTFCGLSVFLEFGLAIPRSGGEKNYLERVYRRPKYLATCIFLSQMVLLGFSAGNCLAFGRYVLFASGHDIADGWQARGIAVACCTFAVLVHGIIPKWGIRLFNVLGVFKVFILLFIVCAGFAALAGHRRIPDPRNFDNAFRQEIGDGDLAKSEVIVAGIFFRNIFGDGAAAKALPSFVAFSNLGNVLAVSFSQARVNQELAKEGLLPWSSFWASNKPFGAPAASLLLHWIMTCIVLIAPPAGPAYNFIVDLGTYPGAWTGAFVVGGLIYLQLKKSENWSSPWHTLLPVSIIYLLANVFLAIVPFVPPTGSIDGEGYPYYVFPIVGIAVILLGIVYWVLWTRVWPRIGGYKIVAERSIGADGEEVVRYKKVKVGKHGEELSI
ncbi:hypothetical protein ABW21_db0206022 [Orbilia brochopaga]|nr:hypothetical protein ABW21_db0206022 [Drechslerella brochopaga]